MPNIDENDLEEGISPISIPLHKNPAIENENSKRREAGGEGNEAGVKRPGSRAEESQGQKVLSKIFTEIDNRIDKRIDSRSALRRADFPFGLILLIIFIAPFIYNAGSDIYFMAKFSLYKSLGGNREILSENQRLTEGIASKLFGAGNSDSTGNSPDSKVAQGSSATKADSFSFKKEKELLIRLSLDIDDPINNSKKIAVMTSVKDLNLIIDSFGRIITNSTKHDISDFHVKNSLKGREDAMNRMAALSK